MFLVVVPPDNVWVAIKTRLRQQYCDASANLPLAALLTGALLKAA